jgi:spore coat polysaccharide biosynthesis predicted glycosyltransferase SpsG
VKSKNILIRTDGSNTSGLGHVSRCLTLANYLKEKGITSTFITSKQEVCNIITGNNFNCIVLDKNNKISHLKEISLSVNSNTIVVDTDYKRVFPSRESYFKYIKDLRSEKYFIISFEDAISADVSSNVVVVPYLGANKINVINTGSKHFFGEKYFLLRSEFLYTANFNVRRKIKKILITMGGSDPEKITLKAIKSICDTNLKVKITVLIGSFSKITRRDIFAMSNGNINILHNTNSISKLMLDCDIAITNSGLTKYELSALGVPYIVISDNNYQENIMSYFARKCICVHAGMVSSLTAYKLSKEIIELSINHAKRVRLSTNGRRLIDGHGADRLYSQIFVNN